MKIKVSILYGFVSLLYLFFISSIYYMVFTNNWKPMGGGDQYYYDIFTFAFNRDSVNYFLPSIISTAKLGYALSGEVVITSPLQFGNNFGLIYLYYFISKIFMLGNNFMLTSLFVNFIIILITYILIYKICNRLNINKINLHLIILLNTTFIFYLQGINKEPFTLLFVFSSTYLLLIDKKAFYFINLLLFTLIRMQHFIFGSYFFFLYKSRNKKSFLYRTVIIYCISSALGAYYAQGITNFGHSLAPGISLFILDLNQQYYIGTFIFGFVKIIQLFYDQLLLSFTFIQDGIINLYFLKETIPTIALLLLSKTIISKYKRGIFYSNEKILFMSIISFLFMQIINPIIHQRYMWPVIITLFIIALNNPNHKRIRYN